ncbi:MAG TPA: MotA/TolQ/ExbB proton channel family protein [Spirochaetota bacterium]|nr:MotA/TolQ/ExbB proton channel family protein [Spirochaetota bacterium]HPI91071.1 MotA/TolQ/ExbB proton channel family protein [Spirochaetota bacterium]HPR49856.1 MotA/TolQ/ExbB proton channel family protein [Spirochaetota bacterium]
MINTLIKGGPVMVPIFILAILSTGIILERLLYLYITSIDYNQFRDRLIKRLNEMQDDLLKLRANSDLASGTLCNCGIVPENPGRGFFAWLMSEQAKRNPYIKIVAVYLKCLEKGERSREEALKRVGSEEIERMERHFKGLSAVSHIAPLLGLLGTVTGIIGAFAVISELGGQVDVSALAGGIWEAMITTAAGLIVAIPSQLAFLYFEKCVDTRANRMSYLITHLNERLFNINTNFSDHCESQEAQHVNDNLLIKHAPSGESI